MMMDPYKRQLLVDAVTVVILAITGDREYNPEEGEDEGEGPLPSSQ